MAPRAQDKSGKRDSDQQPVSLVIPCRAEYLGLCRVLAGVVGARGCMGAEDIADLKLVITEACTCFLPGSQEEPSSGSCAGTQEGPDSLRVELTMGTGAWEVTVCDAEQRYAISEDSACAPFGPGGLGLTIMRALVDRVEHDRSESGGSIIRMYKQVDAGVGDPS